MSKTDLKPKNCRKMALAGISGQALPYPDLRWDYCVTWIYHGLRLALAGVFIYAGVIKLLDPRAFAHAIAQYDLVPEGLLPLVAIMVPGLELAAGLGLILEIRGSLTTVVSLLLLFLVLLGYAIWANLDIDCGCFTPAELDAQHNLQTAFWRDLIMIGATLFLYWRRRNRSPQSLWIQKLKTRLKGEVKK